MGTGKTKGSTGVSSRELVAVTEVTGVSKASPKLNSWTLLGRETGNRSSVLLVGSRSVHREGVKTVASMLRTCLSPFPELRVSVLVSGAAFGRSSIKLGGGRDRR